jgi:hypothetical protein
LELFPTYGHNRTRICDLFDVNVSTRRLEKACP